MSISTQQHRAEAPDQIRIVVITISDTRTKENDTSGKTIVDMLEQSGQKVVAWEIVPDEPARIRDLIDRFITQGSGVRNQESATSIPHSPLPTPHSELIDAILLTGGTGVGSRDQTFETISGMLTKTLPGFGEIFRMLSFAEVGAAAMLSRATGGLIGKTVVLAMPGSTNAVRLAMEKLIVPELRHLVREARR
jgi:molybdenum cofactor biosynthesis protein B